MSRHWTKHWGYLGKAIEAIPTCKDASGWDQGEINTEHKCEEFNVTKETKEIHRDWSSELCRRDTDNGVTQPSTCRCDWHAVGDDEPHGRVKERKFYVRGQHVREALLACLDTWRKAGVARTGWGQQGPAHAVPASLACSPVTVCAPRQVQEGCPGSTKRWKGICL